MKTKAGTTYINNELAKGASQSYVNTALALKADKFELTALNNTVNTLEAMVGQLQKAVEFYAEQYQQLLLLQRWLKCVSE